MNLGYDDVVRREGPKDGSAAHFYYSGDTFLAVDAMNDPVAYNVAKRLLAAGRPLPRSAALDPTVDLKALLAAD